MVPKNIAALFLLYARPVVAIGRILDEGRLWFSVAAAILVSWLLHFSDGRLETISGAGDDDSGPGPVVDALLHFISYGPGTMLLALGSIVIVLVPAILLIRAVSGFGSFSVLMESDYLGLVNCALLSWTAAYLPLAAARMAVDNFWLETPYANAAVNLYFVVLMALSVRAVFGTSLGPAAGMTALAWVAALCGGAVFGVAGGALRYLASPFLLYYAYIMFGSEFRNLGQGLRSRQHLRNQLEMATTNPRDADAHYQLGLIYQSRRQYSEAIARFTRAVEIDPSEADAHHQLGCIARAQGRFDDAIRHLQTASSLNDKLATSEVWRELGAAYVGASRFEEAATALEKFTDRRSYDPEGLYWYGIALLRLNRNAEAKDLFERSIEAVKTMPRHRRAHVRKWGSLASKELRGVK